MKLQKIYKLEDGSEYIVFEQYDFEGAEEGYFLTADQILKGCQPEDLEQGK